MTDAERETARTRAIELLTAIKNRADTLNAGVPELCEQMLKGDKVIKDLVEVIREHDELKRTYNVALEQFNKIVYPPSVENNQQLFFEALDEVKEQKVVTTNDINLLESLVIASDQVTQDALIEFKQRVAH